MDNNQNNQTSLIPTTAISDLALVLKDKGLTDEEVDNTLMDIVAEVQIQVVEELTNGLSDEQKAMLDAMIEQNKPNEEVAQALNLDLSDLNRIEAQKFAEVLKELGPSLGI